MSICHLGFEKTVVLLQFHSHHLGLHVLIARGASASQAGHLIQFKGNCRTPKWVMQRVPNRPITRLLTIGASSKLSLSATILAVDYYITSSNYCHPSEIIRVLTVRQNSFRMQARMSSWQKFNKAQNNQFTLNVGSQWSPTNICLFAGVDPRLAVEMGVAGRSLQWLGDQVCQIWVCYGCAGCHGYRTCYVQYSVFLVV